MAELNHNSPKTRNPICSIGTSPSSSSAAIAAAAAVAAAVATVAGAAATSTLTTATTRTMAGEIYVGCVEKNFANE